MEKFLKHSNYSNSSHIGKKGIFAFEILKLNDNVQSKLICLLIICAC
jgi:hypothetical protein